MECKNCGYFWADYDEETGEVIGYPYCHFVDRAPGDVPPCEDDYYEERLDEYGY